MPLPYLAGEDSASSHSAVLQAATRWSTEIRRLALSLALPYQPVGRPQADTCRCHQLKRAPRATAVAALVPQSVANRSASKSDEARGVSGSAAAVLAAVSCRATAQAMENDSNPQTERHEGSSLAGAHSTAVSQQAQTAWSSVWEQRASTKDAEFVTRLGELRQRQKQVRKDAKAAGRTVTIAEVPEALKQQQREKEETARSYFERVHKGGRVLTKLKPVTVGDLVIQRYRVATVDLPTDDEAAAMSEVVLMKYVIRDKLIQHRKIPSDTPALVYVEEASYAEFLYLPRAFSHMARCATHRVPLYFGAFTPHTQVESCKLAYLIC